MNVKCLSPSNHPLESLCVCVHSTIADSIAHCLVPLFFPVPRDWVAVGFFSFALLILSLSGIPYQTSPTNNRVLVRWSCRGESTVANKHCGEGCNGPTLHGRHVDTPKIIRAISGGHVE